MSQTEKNARAIMVQGTCSGAGKSLLVCALARIFTDEGVDVVPFKAQNMALNSYVTPEGGEIGRAQALQAEACKKEPHTDMNPVLLKASGESGSQVIVHGAPVRMMKASEYYAYREEAWRAVAGSLGRLQKKHELIVLEGAGSPAEINLMKVDIVNMAAARAAKAPVILVGDIDRGGVFASLYGTVELLQDDRELIKGFVVNKFRGDMEILRPGLKMISDKTGIPVLGVLPYIQDMGLAEEDGMPLSYKGRRTGDAAPVRVAVVRLKYISNFTDFDPFVVEPDVELSYTVNPLELENADVVIIPGSKNTVTDLMFLKENGLDRAVEKAAHNGALVIGVCGGYQMLGRRLLDPEGVESPNAEVRGLGLLKTTTTFKGTKRTLRVRAEFAKDGLKGLLYGYKGDGRLQGYEIHMGESRVEGPNIFTFNRITSQGSETAPDGAFQDNIFGTYLHGLFDDDHFRRALLDGVRLNKGLKPIGTITSFSDQRSAALDRLADSVKTHLDIGYIRKLIWN